MAYAHKLIGTHSIKLRDFDPEYDAGLKREQGEEKQSRHRVWRDQTKPHRGSSSKVCNRQSHRQQNQPRRCRARRQAGERAPWIA